MQDATGVGLAANQVGVLQRVLVMQPDEEEPIALVNPVLASPRDEVETDDEGCLSLQGVTVPVERSGPRSRSTRSTRAASKVELELEGLPARVVQHELDHLDGVLILERTTDDARREALAVLCARGSRSRPR